MNDLQQRRHFRHFAKADVYRLLSACYYQPEDAFLEEDVFLQLKTALSKASPGGVMEAAALDDCFRASGVEALMLDYSRLFLGPFEILAKPYGSVYLDGEKVVMGDSTMQALELYREGGFEVAEDFREMPDHIAVELEFLSLLSFRIGQEADDEECARLVALKQRFLKNHPGRWVETFSAAMRDGAETDFYKVLAGLTEAFVCEDLSELIETGKTQ
jgi:TorA maturation chaperone TorD